GLTMLQAALDIFHSRLANRAGEYLLQGDRLGLLGGFQVIDAIKGRAYDFGDDPPEVVVIEVFVGWPIQRDRDAGDTSLGNGRDGGSQGAAPAFARKVLRSPQAREQRARSFDSAQIRQKQGLSGAPGEIPPAQQLLQKAMGSRIDPLRLFPQLAVLE